MSDFVKVMAAADLPPGSGKEVVVAGKAVALFNVAGSFHAIGNTCVHRGGPLGQGSLDGAVVMCPWHAWTYDVTTGVSTVNPDLKVPRHEVRLEGGEVFVKLE